MSETNLDKTWDYPTAGGSYVRDDATGALTRVEPLLPADPAPPGPGIAEGMTGADPGVEGVAAPEAQPTGTGAAGKNRKGTV